MTSQPLLKFPYGNSDFYRISSQRQFYLDRTAAIPLLEEAGEQLLFLRPRRFGKSLPLSVLESEKSIELLIALLYYLGVLTLAGRDENGKLLLQIPNLVIRRLYAERLREVLLPSARTRDAGKVAAEALYQRGELQPLCDFVEQK